MNLLHRIINIFRAKLSVGEKSADDFQWDFEDVSSAEGNFSGYQKPPETPKDPIIASYYAHLEVAYGADLETVTRSWKRLLRKYHPDMYSNDPEKQAIANRLVQELNHSYNELKKFLSK
jgi:DnaJ-domain-containing protein 1